MSTKTDPLDFDQFMLRRKRAASAYVSGDFRPLDEIAARELPATFFGPSGGYVVGTDRVANRYASDAASFKAGGSGTFEILDSAADDCIAYWVGFQKATAYMQGMDEPTLFDLRITEIFRLENGMWKLVHRHADTLIRED